MHLNGHALGCGLAPSCFAWPCLSVFFFFFFFIVQIYILSVGHLLAFLMGVGVLYYHTDEEVTLQKGQAPSVSYCPHSLGRRHMTEKP